MPVIADIRRRHPDAQIDWLVEESFAGLVELVDGVRRAIPVFAAALAQARFSSPANWREIGTFRRALAAEKYDLVIDCQGLIKTAWVASWARGPLVGLGNRTDGAGFEWPVRFFYDQRVPIEPRTHVVERTRQLVAAALDLPRRSPPTTSTSASTRARAALALSRAGSESAGAVCRVRARHLARRQAMARRRVDRTRPVARAARRVDRAAVGQRRRARDQREAREGIRRGRDRAAEAVAARGGRPDRRRGGDGRRRYRARAHCRGAEAADGRVVQFLDRVAHRRLLVAAGRQSRRSASQHPTLAEVKAALAGFGLL